MGIAYYSSYRSYYVFLGLRIRTNFSRIVFYIKLELFFRSTAVHLIVFTLKKVSLLITFQNSARITYVIFQTHIVSSSNYWFGSELAQISDSVIKAAAEMELNVAKA